MAFTVMLHCTGKQNGNAITDELPNIPFSLTTVRDTSLPGIQTYFIYSSQIIGKSPWIRGGTSLYGLYRYVRPQRVWFFSYFGHK